MNDKTGGPAFPAGAQLFQGMALRDYFAAKAMQGLLAVYPDTNHEYLAANSYSIADAMLSERNKGE